MQKEQLMKAFQLMKQGEKGQASMIVKGILRDDPKNLNAWWLMSHLLDDEDKVVKALERVLSIDPTHQAARQRLAKMRPEYSNLVPQSTAKEGTKKTSAAQSDGYWDKLSNPPKKSKSNTDMFAGFFGIMGTRLGIRLVIMFVFLIGAGVMAAYNAFYDQFMIADINGNTPQDVIWDYEHAYWLEDWDTMYALSCSEYHSTVRELQDELYALFGPTPSGLTVDMSGVTMETLQRNPPDKYTIGFHGDVISYVDGESYTYNYDDDIAEQGGNMWLGEHVTRIDGVWLVCTGPETIYR